MPIRPLLILLLATSLLAACRAKEEPRPADSPAEEAAIAAAGAALTATGQTSFHGGSSFFCVPHAERGLQVDFRTGSAAMPAVAVRIEDFRGSGPYQARLFVTGRTSSGALVTSPGEASVEVRQQNPVEEGAAATVSGTFHGRYDGAAGKGEIEGRFASCNYSPSRGGSSPPVAGAVSATGEERPAGAAEETPEKPPDAPRLSAPSRGDLQGHPGRKGHRGPRRSRSRRHR